MLVETVLPFQSGNFDGTVSVLSLVQLKLTGIPHRQPQALVTAIRPAGGFAAISRWLSASDTAGLWNNNDRHPGGVPTVISIERFSINASAATPPGCFPFSPHAHREAVKKLKIDYFRP
jgi:hypothetical protein